MFGCVGRIVMAVILLIVGAVGWHYRARWVPQVKHYIEQRTGIDLGEQPGGVAYSWERA